MQFSVTTLILQILKQGLEKQSNSKLSNRKMKSLVHYMDTCSHFHYE